MLYKYNFSGGKDREGVVFCNWTMSEEVRIAFEQALIAEVNRLGLIIEKPVKVEHSEIVEETRYIQILKESIERIYNATLHFDEAAHQPFWKTGYDRLQPVFRQPVGMDDPQYIESIKAQNKRMEEFRKAGKLSKPIHIDFGENYYPFNNEGYKAEGDVRNLSEEAFQLRMRALDNQIDPNKEEL